MRELKRIARWFSLMERRLFRRPSFCLLLACMPLLVLGLRLAAAQDSGIVTIAAAREQADDIEAGAVLERLTRDPSILEIVVCDTPEEALALVSTGRADAAWVLRAGFGARVRDAASGAEVTLVTVTEREDTVFLRLAREKLFAALYPALSYALYRDLVLSLPSDAAPGEDELRTYYALAGRDSRFIQFSAMDGAADSVGTDYLVMPVRGMLALTVLLAALASAMYLSEDMAAERFAWLSPGKRRLLPLLFHLPAVLDTALAALVALWASGLASAGAREVPLMLLYCLACAGFAEVFRRLLGSVRRMGGALPVTMLGMLALCPVFLNVRRFRPVQFLLPPFHYLHSIGSRRYALYLLVCALACWTLALLPTRRRNVPRSVEQ